MKVFKPKKPRSGSEKAEQRLQVILAVYNLVCLAVIITIIYLLGLWAVPLLLLAAAVISTRA